MSGIICLDCLWYDSMTYDDYVPQIGDYELFTEHYCKAHGFRKLDWEEMEEIVECKDYMKE